MGAKNDVAQTLFWDKKYKRKEAQDLIKVCDSIMGSGKTTAAIRYMNEHQEKKYIYLAPYKSEADRIQSACPLLKFKRPTYQVILHSTDLISSGENIATTHQAFKLYNPEIRKLIKEVGYTLIVDESLELLEELEFSIGDLETCVRAGYVKIDSGMVRLVDDSYDGKSSEYKSFFSVLRCRDLLMFNDGEQGLYYWLLPADLLQVFDDVIVMTYMFEGQEMSGLLKMEGLEYKYIGLERDDDGVRFSESGSYVPEYTKRLRGKIHILDNAKMNAIGCDEFALSSHWFTRPENEEKVATVRKNLYNYFRNVTESQYSERMWSSYISSKSKLRGKGYTNCFVQFNAKSENKYSNKRYLAYLPNIFMNVSRKLYLSSRGAEINDDVFALSNMVQWIWRSAIRNGEDVYIYIPSRRMRMLLIGWMDSLAEGGE